LKKEEEMPTIDVAVEHITKVIASCKTHEQLRITTDWYTEWLIRTPEATVEVLSLFLRKTHVKTATLNINLNKELGNAHAK
jgi:hypothetical protein